VEVFKVYRPAKAARKTSSRRCAAAVSRKLRILRAHGLIQKIPKAHRDLVTSHDRLAITTILTMYRASIALLDKTAA